ncbi:pre-peptidase C-terminal domain-containing protein [Treponema sp. R6D11]
MKKITLFKRAFWIAGLTALTALFFACDNGLQFEKLWNDAGKTTVSFTVSDGTARTVLPQVSLNDVARYTLLGGISGTEETTLKEFTGTGTSVSLYPGTWNFTLNAYNASGAQILQGKVQDKQINLSENNQVSFSMSVLKSGTGSIQVTFSFPETAGITQINVKGDVSTENFTPDSGGNFVYAKDEFVAGDYFINFEFYRGDTLQVVISELFLVRNGLTSVKTITLVGEDLKPILTGMVSISGKPESGQILTANTDLLDGVGSINYQWNKDATAIIGATAVAYAVQSADIGSTITVTVTRKGYLGSITSEPIDVEKYITLTANTWADGDLPNSGSEQWFKFTATASTQYIHVSFGTLPPNLYVQLYDSSGNEVGYRTNLRGSSKSTSLSVTTNQVYYIKVTSYWSYDRGTYQIAFNTDFIPPGVAIQLTANTWADGNLPDSGSEQWFTFTATAYTQYIHASFGTLTDLYVQVYNSSGYAGNRTNLRGSTKYISQSVTPNQVYYIKVTPYSSSDSGTYQIAFNTGFIIPGVAIQLTANTWADGDLPNSSSEQWFTFTATANTQYIHVSFGTLKGLDVQVYDSSSNKVGSQTDLHSSSPYTSRSVTPNQVYYIRVTPFLSGYSGTYKIAFNTDFIPPGVAIQLTANTWADGNLPNSSSEQWFKFTATASTQYIHVAFGSLNDLYVQVYDSSGATVGSETYLYNLYNSTKYISRTVTSGQVYYIRVRPYGSNSGTYKIAFNTSSTPPN